MKRIKSLIAATLMALFSVALILPIAACVNDEALNGNAIYVTSEGGMALGDITVELLDGETSLGLKKTDTSGKVTYSLDASKTYTAKLTEVPVGFLPKDSYTVKGSDKTTYIRISSQIITEGTPTSYYTRGDVMYDFEETYYTYNSETGKADSIKAKLSDLFAEGKKAVMIDFFYNNCSACNNEYPFMSAAYKNYADKLAILGINDVDSTIMNGETLTDVQNKVVEDKVPYYMCKDSANIGFWFTNIVKGQYPTAIMIDRYGIICEYVVGSVVEQSTWENWFEKYTSDNYSQDITQGDDSGEIFVPDEPDDFNAQMPNTNTLKSNTNINNTNNNTIYFSRETTSSSYGWPWDLTEDGTALYPTNSGHMGTFATIYVQIELDEGDVFAFDYKLSTMPSTNYFYVSVDSRKGTGRQISMEAGVQDWQTGFAYVALEKSTHEIAFSYYKSTTNVNIGEDDKVYINNLRILTVEEMNDILVDREQTLEIPYFATREYVKPQFTKIENVYLANDGYYHVGAKDTAKDSDPYLMMDITHPTPYFGSGRESLNTLYNTAISNVGGLIVGGVNLTNQFGSYISFSTNSDYTGLIPVTEEIKANLTALYNDNIPKNTPYWSANGWLQFCVFYKQYGVQQALTDPIKGLAYFSAFEAKETTNEETYIPVEEGKGQFWLNEKGQYVDVEGTSYESRGNYNLNPVINEVQFDKIIMPLGYMYKFIPSRSGAYRIYGLDCYYMNDSESVVDGEEVDAALFDGNLNVSHMYATANQILFDSNSDRYYRNDDTNSFRINYYLEQGKTYYILVNFRVVETTGNFSFRIDWVGETDHYLSQASSNYYLQDETGAMQLPLYCDPYYDETNDVWLDAGGSPIYLDMTELTCMFDYCPIETIITGSGNTAQFTFDFTKDIVYTVTDEDGNEKTVTLHFDLNELFSDEKGNVHLPEFLEGVEVKDYTDIMLGYLAKSKEVGKDSELYGLVPVNKELYGILQLYNVRFWGYDTDTEWLRGCWYTVNVGPNSN